MAKAADDQAKRSSNTKPSQSSTSRKMTAKRARDDSAKALGSAPAIKKRWALLQQSKPDFSQCRQRGSSLIAGADCARAAGVDTPAKSAGIPTERMPPLDLIQSRGRQPGFVHRWHLL